MVIVLLLTLASACLASKLPVVDLGYELHQAISFNVSGALFGLIFLTDVQNRAPMVSIISAISAMRHLQLATCDSRHLYFHSKTENTSRMAQWVGYAHRQPHCGRQMSNKPSS